MDNISSLVYKEMLKKEYWDSTFEKMSNKRRVNHDIIDDLYVIKSTNKYKKLAKKVALGTYSWSIPDKLELRKDGGKKKRIVYMYSMIDRFILGVLYRALSNLFIDRVPENCFSYKRGISTCDAIKYIKKVKQSDKLYGVKLDISSYFNSVNRQHLNNCLTELFGVNSGIRKTMDMIFNNNNCVYNGKVIEEYKALVPGCALGSFFANYCLKEVDNYFIQKGVVYARYSDDIIVLAETKDKVGEYLEFIKSKIFSYGLTINESKYVHFNPDDSVDYLGLSLSESGIDISPHAKMKLKRTIKRWVKAGRKAIEINGEDFDKVAKRIINRLNWKLYKSYIKDIRKFGWAYYAFRYITIKDSLTEIDFYLRDRLRYLKTGRNNKANVKALNDEDFRNLGVLSLYDMYELFHNDFDYYCEVIYLI